MAVAPVVSCVCGRPPHAQSVGPIFHCCHRDRPKIAVAQRRRFHASAEPIAIDGDVKSPQSTDAPCGDFLSLYARWDCCWCCLPLAEIGICWLGTASSFSIHFMWDRMQQQPLLRLLARIPADLLIWGFQRRRQVASLVGSGAGRRFGRCVAKNSPRGNNGPCSSVRSVRHR